MATPAPSVYYGNFRILTLVVCTIRVTLWLLRKQPSLMEGGGKPRPIKQSQVSSVRDSANSTVYYDSNLFPLWDTNFSTPESVLQHGFPCAWRPCTLYNAMSSRRGDDDRPMQMVILGGSASAHSAQQCRTDQALFAGRYSNVLKKRLHADVIANSSTTLSLSDWLADIKVINRAQGATDSLWNALLLDELVVPEGTDVLLWEFGINDALGGTTKSPIRSPAALKQMLNLWLWRVASLFAAHNMTSPPLICLFLWDADFYIKSKDPNESNETIRINHQHHTIAQTAWESQREVIEHYRNLGWNIAVINVAAAIDGTAVVHDPSLLLDDTHHPNCQGVQLIASMIQHVFYQDQATCTPSHLDSASAQNNNTLTPFPWKSTKKQGDNYTVSDGKSSDGELLDTLFQDHTRVKVGSITPWQPTLDISTLNISTDGFATNYVQPIRGSRSVPWRKDRKYGYMVPFCSANDELQWMIHERGLAWLGLGFQNHDNHWIQITVNGASLISNLPSFGDPSANGTTSYPRLSMDSVGEFERWVRLADLELSYDNHNTACTLSFCYLHKMPQVGVVSEGDFAPQVTWIVGVVELANRTGG